MAELLPTLTSIAAVLFFVFALLSRKKLMETQALLIEASLRVENAQKQFRNAEQNFKNQSDQLDKLRQQNQQFEKTLEEAKLRLSERTIEWNRLKLEKDEISQRAVLQREHLEEQVQAMTQQLSEAVREKRSALEEAAKLHREGDEKTSKQADILRGQLKENQAALQAARREKQQSEQQLERLKEQYGQIKPDELKRSRLKVLRLEQLYASMRGLREMAEERNKNWETALRSFAVHILQQSPASSSQMPIGPLVGAALEKIGARLVDDDEGVEHGINLVLPQATALNGTGAEEMQPVQL